MNRLVTAIAVGCLGLLACGCTTIGTDALSTNSDSYAGGTASAKNYLYSWALPKTIFDATVTWQFKGCKVQEGILTIDVQPAVTAIPHAVADQDIGWVTLDAASIHSFLQDHTFEVKTAPGTHLLQSFSSTATDQTGQIIGNVLSAATKVVGIALGVPTALGGTPPVCGPAQEKLSTITDYQKKLAAMPDQNSADAKTLATTIASLQDKINIKVTASIDPGVTPIAPDTTRNPPIVNGRAGGLTISKKQMTDAGWYPPDNLPDGWASEYQIDAYLIFEQANPVEFSCVTPCTKTAPQKLTRGAMFREVAYVPIELRWTHHVELPAGTKVTEVLGYQVQPFAQFGASRKLPLDAPLFGKANWNLTFNEFGEITDATWGSAATGVAATALLNSAATAGSSIDSERLKAAQQLDSATLAKQLENSKLQIIINNATYMQQCVALQAKGAVTQCP